MRSEGTSNGAQQVCKIIRVLQSWDVQWFLSQSTMGWNMGKTVFSLWGTSNLIHATNQAHIW